MAVCVRVSESVYIKINVLYESIPNLICSLGLITKRSLIY